MSLSRRKPTLKALGRTDEFLRLVVSEIQIQTDASAADLAAILAALGSLSTEITVDQINLNVDDLERSNIAIEVAVEALLANIGAANNRLYRLENEAEDTVTAITFLDAADCDNRREDTMTLSSVALGISVTKTFAYAGIPGDYYVTTITVT